MTQRGAYFTTYWDRWPGLWHHGDWAERDGQGVWFIRGRSDDTLKIAGKRVGPAEVEGVVNTVPGVVESAAVGLPDPVKGDSLVVFARVAARPGVEPDPTGVVAAIRAEVAARLGKPLTPKRVHLVDALPRTRSGKILRRLIKAAYLGEALGDLSALENPAALEDIGAVR